MTTIKHLAPSTYDLLDEEALIKEARTLARRRRRRGLLVVTLAAVACLIVVGVDRFSSSPATAPSSNNDASASAALTCPSAHMKLLGVTAISGGLGHAGVVVRASVSSSATCAMRGYPTVGAGLSSHSTAMASDLRLGYLGGWATGAPTPRLSITSRPRVVSFTIQWTDGNGPTCPSVNAIQVTLPGSRKVLTARSMYEGGIGNTRFMGIYCSHLSVTPLVKGSSGSAR